MGKKHVRAFRGMVKQVCVTYAAGDASVSDDNGDVGMDRDVITSKAAHSIDGGKHVHSISS